MRNTYSEIVIDTQSSTIWNLLVSLEKYVAWNPFLKEAEGDVKTGEKIRVYTSFSGNKGYTSRPKITRLVENSELRWQSRYMIPGLFDQEHIFELVPITQNSTKFVHTITFRGILVPLYGNSIKSEIKKGMEEMSRALKLRAESSIKHM